MAKEYYNRAVECISDGDEDEDFLIIKTRLHINIGTLMFSLKNYSLAVDNYEVALQASEKVNKITNNKYVDDIFTCYSSMGYTYLSLGNLEQAEAILKKFFNKIYKDFEGEKKTSWLSNKAALQDLIGQLYWKRGKIELAEQHYIKALGYYGEYSFMEINPFEVEMAEIHNNIAVMKSEIGELDDAMKHYKITCEKFDVMSKKEKKYRENKAYTDFNISICLYKKKDFKAAEQYASSALELYKTMYTEGCSQFAEEVKKAGRQLLEICIKRRRFIKGIKCYWHAISLIGLE